MNIKQLKFLNACLGDDFFQDMKKSELYKPNSNVTVDPHDAWIAYQIVPRTILSWLINNLKPVEVGGIFKADIPGVDGRLELTKVDRDVYSGQIYGNSDNKKLYELKYRSLPAIGLCILTTFELYQNEEQEKSKAPEIIQAEAPHESEIAKLQRMIEERLHLRSLVSQVVENKLNEKEAMEKFFMAKISHHFNPVFTQHNEEDDSKNKKIKLLEFLESRKNRQEVQIEKKEDMDCSSCGTQIYKSGESHVKCCVCYGESFGKEIKFAKNESGIKFKFPKGFSAENIELILETIKNKRG
jgi:LSD1 subclass zinc finger protein